MSAGGVVVTNVMGRFIEYLSQEDANYAVKELNGRELCGSIVEVTPYVRSCILWSSSHTDHVRAVGQVLTQTKPFKF